MADAGYFRGTSADQDNRFSDKEKKLLKTMKFEEVLAKKIDMTKVKVDVLKPWITKRTTEMLKIEDDVVVEFIFNQLEEKSFNNRSSAAVSFFLWSLTLLLRIKTHLLRTGLRT